MSPLISALGGAAIRSGPALLMGGAGDSGVENSAIKAGFGAEIC